MLVSKRGISTITRLGMSQYPWRRGGSYFTLSLFLYYCRQWRQEQAEMLAKKDAEENAALEELRAQARTELAEWYARSDEQLGQTKTSNRCDVLYNYVAIQRDI